MPADLPTTAIALIAFIVAGAGYLILRISNQNKEMNEKNIATFMTYIEKKNGIVERTANIFVQRSEQQLLQFADALIKQGERHKESMDDMAARLEASLSKPK